MPPSTPTSHETSHETPDETPDETFDDTSRPTGGVVVREVSLPDELLDVSGLFEQVWGRNDEGVPMSSELMRSLVHAGGLVSAAFGGERSDRLVGAAVAGRGLPGECYGFIAAVAPGSADRGIGYALKAHQRAWALAHDLPRMHWTFDPLVARNARFNLTKLGAICDTYEVAFYGEMQDAQNAGEVGDRLVASWALDSARVANVVGGIGAAGDPAEPMGAADAYGPDGEPAAWSSLSERWIRVPSDISALRRDRPAEARAWRLFAREQFTAAFAEGWVADGVTRTSCYHLTRESR